MRVTEAMGLRAGEGPRCFRLGSFVFLLTAAAVLAKSAQRDIFLAAYPRSRIPDAFLFSALTLCVVSLGISALAVRLGLVRLMQTLLWGSALLLVLGRLVLGEGFAAGPLGVYVLVEVLVGVLLTQGWGVASEAVDVRAAKRLLPLVGVGAGLAWMVGGFAVGALAQKVSSLALLACAPLLLVGASLVLGLITQKDIDARQGERDSEEGLLESLGAGLRYILNEPLMRILAAIITTELVVERVVDFQLLSAAQVHFGSTAGGVASFMGLFYGVTGAVTLVAPFLFSGKVLSRFGSTRTLVAAQLWVLAGSVAFLLFPLFSVVVLLAGGDRILKQSLTGAARSQIFGAVPSVRRAQAGAILRGVLAALFSALAAVALKAVPPDLPLQWLSPVPVVLMAALVIWTGIGLRKSYVLALRRSVDRRKLDLDDSSGPPSRELDGEQVATLASELRSSDGERASFALSILGTAKADRVRPLLVEALTHPSQAVRAHAVQVLGRYQDRQDVPTLVKALEEAESDEVRCAALRVLAEVSAKEAAPAVAKLLGAPSPRVRALARAAQVRLGGTLLVEKGSEALAFDAMLRSRQPEERAAAAWAMSELPLPQNSLLASFVPLLADASLAVRQAALRAAGSFDDPAISRALVFALEDPATASAAFEAFPRMDEAGVARVGSVLADAPAAVVSWAASALASVPPAGANDLLEKLLSHEDSQVRYRASRALALRRRRRGWAPPAEELLLAAVNAELERGYAYYATLVGVEASLRAAAPGVELSAERGFILGEIDSRIQETERRLLALIALIADPRIARLSHHLRDASPQVTARLLELLEQSLDAELAARVVPFLERATHEARTKVGAEHFGISSLFQDDPLAGIIELKDLHLRRCALLVFGDSIALRYPELLNREEPLLPLVERIRFLRSVPLFKGLSPEDLMKLAEIAESVEHRSGDFIFRKGDPGDVLCVVVSGKVDIRDQNQVIATQGPNDFFGELALFDHEPRSADAVASADTELLEIGGADLEALMERRPEIAREVVRVLARRLRRTTEAMLVKNAAPKAG